MGNRKNLASEYGSFNPFVFAIVALAISAVLVAGVTAVLAPAFATSNTSTKNITPYPDPMGYFPNEFINQAKEVEPEMASMVEPEATTSDDWSIAAVAGDGPGYLPAQIVNQAKDFEPVPESYYSYY